MRVNRSENRQPVPTSSGQENSQTDRLAFAGWDPSTDTTADSLAALRQQFLSSAGSWLDSPVERLYDVIRDFRRLWAQTGGTESHLSEALSSEMVTADGVESDVVEGNETKTAKSLQSLNFFCNVNILASLQDSYAIPEITAYFPVFSPEQSSRCREAVTSVRLQQIENQCIELLQDEYLFIARLLTLWTLEEKHALCADYLFRKEGVMQIEQFYAQLPSPAERILYLARVFDSMLDHYAYAMAGFMLLADKIRELGRRQDMDLLEKVNLMLACVNAAKKVIQTRNLHMEEDAAVSGACEALLPVRFNLMLDRLTPLYHALHDYRDKELLPALRQKEFGVREKTVKRKPAISRPQKPSPAIKTPVLPQLTPAGVTEAKDKPVASEAKPAAMVSGPVEAEEVVSPEAEVSEALPREDDMLPSVLPVKDLAANTEPAQIMLLARNPKIAGLNKHHMETYEQIFAERWREARHLTLSAVEKLVRQLGGQTRGAGGSRTQIIFHDKSVATIEHRHGRDKAGELYKMSVALLQRGLGIAGFAPPGWVDELSRARDVIANFWDYAAKHTTP